MIHYYRLFDLFPAGDCLLEPQQLHRQGVSMETQGFLCERNTLGQVVLPGTWKNAATHQ